LPELTKEDKSIEAMNSRQMPIPQDSKYDNPIRMSISKVSCKTGNRICRLSQLMKEESLSAVMRNSQMRTRQYAKRENQVRISLN
jgi:hypothetical protein